jgi:hypothetical protein
MRDIAFNIETNDVEFLDGDFRPLDKCGQQNAALIIAKSCVDIMRPQYGVGLYEIYANMKAGRLRTVLDDATRQIYDDGAASAYISYTPTDNGEYDIVSRVKYKGE